MFYHGPELCANKQIRERNGHVRRGRPDQLAVVMSMESAANYGCLDDPPFMAEFDLEMTYRQEVRRLLPALAMWGGRPVIACRSQAGSTPELCVVEVQVGFCADPVRLPAGTVAADPKSSCRVGSANSVTSGAVDRAVAQRREVVSCTDTVPRMPRSPSCRSPTCATTMWRHGRTTRWCLLRRGWTRRRTCRATAGRPAGGT